MPDDTLWDEYIKKFSPPFNCLSPPVRCCFTDKQGQKLKIAKVKWTRKPFEVESEVVSKLEDRQPFVFYCNGSYSGVNTECGKVYDIVFHELNRLHYLLVVGDDSGIEEEIQQDIKIIASLADLKDEEFTNLCKSLEQSDYKFGTCYTNKAVYTIQIDPKINQLKETLHKKLLCCGRKLTVIYSGHANSNGEWGFSDGVFSAHDLKMVVQCTKRHIQHDIRINIILNCCYGLVFAKKLVGSIQTFLEVLKINLNEDTNNNYTTCDIERYASSKLIDCTEKSIELNHLIIKAIACKMYKIDDRVITMKDLNLHIQPYTFGPLVAQGVLYDVLKIKSTYLHELNILKIRTALLSCREPTTEGNNCIPANPQLIVFPAGNGDSTLFRWHDFNMLIDGGIYKDQPCFWETVRQLPTNQKLDVVVVTHSDTDHVSGVLRIFEENSLPITVGKLYTTIPLLPQIPNVSKNKQRPRGTELWSKAIYHMEKGSLTAVSNLITDPHKHVVYKKFNGGDTLEVFMLTPTKPHLDKAAKLLPFIRSSPLENQEHNMASASLLIKCYKTSEPCKFALLTGDAPSEDITRALDTIREITGIPYNDERYNLNYMDMPHHGSKINNPKYLLSKIQSDVCVVSTNSRRFGGSSGHPDVETLDALNEAMIQGNIKRLLFTYRNDRGHRIITESQKNNEDVLNDESKAKCSFANNNPRNKNNNGCFLVELNTQINPQELLNSEIFNR